MKIQTATYPALPSLIARQAGESLREYAKRALEFVIDTRQCATLDDQTLDLAVSLSTGIVAGELSDTARENLHGLRLMMMQAQNYRRQLDAQTARAALAAASAKPKSGGLHSVLKRPVPIVPPAGAGRRL